MVIPAFDKDSAVGKVYQQLKTAGVTDETLDQGYYQIDYSKPGPNEKRIGAKDGTMDPLEIYEYALEHYEQYREVVEGITGKPIPWELDDFDPTTDFDANIRAKVNAAITQLRQILAGQGITPNTPEYQEKLAVGLHYFAYFLDGIIPDDIKDNFNKLLQKTGELKELKEVGLEKFQDWLFKHGGLGTVLIREDAAVEASALEALRIKKGWCTEKSKILYAIFKMAGLQPVFVMSDSKELSANAPVESREASKQVVVKLRSRGVAGHADIGVSIGARFRIFDLAIGNSNMKFSNYHQLGLRQYLSMDLSNRGGDLYKQQKLEEANSVLSKAETLDPQFIQAILNHTGVLMDMAENRKSPEKEDALAKVAAKVKQVLAMDPKNAFAHDQFGIIEERRGHMKEAEKNFRRAITLDPTFIQAYGHLAYLLKNEGKQARAEEVYRKIFPQDLDCATCGDFVDILLEDNKPVEAIPVLKRLLAKDPNNMKVQFWLSFAKIGAAIAQAKKGGSSGEQDNTGLEQDIQKVRAALREVDDLTRGMGKWLQTLSQKKTSSLLADPALNAAFVKLAMRIGDIYSGAGELKQALSLFRLASQINPDTEDAYWKLYETHKAMRNLPEALRACLKYKKLTQLPAPCPTTTP